MVEQTDSLASYDELAAFFAETGLMHQVDSSERSVKIPTSKGPLDGAMFIRWNPGHKVVHFVQTLEFEIPVDRLPAVALAQAVLNHAMPVPGFGINLEHRRSYFRTSMPLSAEGTISKRLVHALFNLGVRTAAQHYLALRDVALEGADPTSILAPGGEPAD